MVTGEFYARVTRRWVTTLHEAPKPLRDKRPACGWLRSSSYNFPDQRDAVTKSLSKNSVVFATLTRRATAVRKVTDRTEVSAATYRDRN